MSAKALSWFVLAATVTGCATSVETAPGKSIAGNSLFPSLTPDDRLYECPVVNDYPDPATATDKDLAKLIITLDNNNRRCAESVKALKKRIEKIRRELEGL